MTHAVRFAVVAVLTALALCAPVQAQTPEIDALRVLAEAGDAVAQFNLGVRYDFGQGVPEDDAEAQYNLGVRYRNGEGVPQHDAEAVRWYRLAADQGVTEAQHNLGVSYENGRGVPQDDVQAHMWFNLTASRSTGEDRESAVSARDRARARMTAEQVAEAQRLAREWDAAHPREP